MSGNKRGPRFMQFLHPLSLICIKAIERPSFTLLQKTFTWIDTVGADCSLAVPCFFYVGKPIVMGKKMCKSDKTIAQIIDDRLCHSGLRMLGIQHAWSLCRHQRDVSWDWLRGIERVWFYGITAYNQAGGEFRPLMHRENNTVPWRVVMAPWCSYSLETDGLGFGTITM